MALIAAAPLLADETTQTAPPWLDGYAVRYVIEQTGGDAAEFEAESIIARIPTGGFCRDDAGDLTVQTADGKMLPLAVIAHAPAGHTLIQFAKQPQQTRYWVYAGHPDATPARREPFAEGLTLEVRRWTGGGMDSWPDVRDGLTQSGPVLDGYAVGSIMQNNNPARPGEPGAFAASYRGYINIKEDGPYTFFVNAEDASFLFIDGFLVCDRPGQNKPLRGRVSLQEVGTTVDLKAGKHRVEVHHVLGGAATAYGLCTLMWFPPDQKGDRKSWSFVTKEHFAHALSARVAAVENNPNGAQRNAVFVHGIDDTLTTDTGMHMYLVQFAAHGDPMPDEGDLLWDFGDGSRGFGRAPMHVYFEDGDYDVTLTVGDDGKPFKQTVHVWPAPTKTSPFSAQRVLDWFGNTDWRGGDEQRIYQMFDFLMLSDQPNRWPLLEQVAGHLITLEDADPQFVADLYAARIEALSRIGRSDEALRVADEAIRRFDKLSLQKLQVQLAQARVNHRMRRLSTAASQYEAIIDEHRRLDDPLLRVAAIRWGDLCTETGNAAQAAECYRLAETLGGDAFRVTALTESVTRGALLRVAEQELRKGDLRKARTLLDKLEMQSPEQKLSGLYRYLVGETNRYTGEYEDALVAYEALLKMTQWAGYHDSAMFGLADTYLRMGDYDRAGAWLANLRESYPDYGEPEKLDRLAEKIAELQTRKAEGHEPLDRITDDFESDEDLERRIKRYGIRRGLGIVGPHVATMDNHAVYRGYLDYELQLTDLQPDGWYWVELWYRESLMQSRVRHSGHIHTWVYDENNKVHDSFHYEGTKYFERTYGEWRKFGFMHKSPVTVNGELRFSLRYNWGDMEVDGVTIRRVSDTEHEALANFIEGAGAEGEAADE